MPIVSSLMARRKSADDEQLLSLFRNRAELKKEFTRLRRDNERLTEQLRQQEGTTLRLQQRLEQLEALLGDAQRAAGIVVHYQLCGVWGYCRRRLTRLAEEMSRRQLEREQQQQLARIAEHRQQAVRTIDRRLTELRQRHEGLQADLDHLADRRRALQGPWHFWRRRQLGQRAHVIQESLASVEGQLRRHERARADRLAELPDPEADLSIDGRRMVNLSLIALAQELLLHFQQHEIARLAREAAARRPGEVNYGSSEHCRRLGQLIGAAVKALEQRHELPERMRRRATMLARSAQYRRENDTVPVASSVDQIPSEPGAVASLETRGAALSVNILAEEYWDIYRVLLS